MKKVLIIVVIFILFLVIAIYSVWKLDASAKEKLGLGDDAFSEQVYYGSVKSNISNNSAKTYSNGAVALGQYSSTEHVDYLKKENNLSNYVYDETAQKEYIRLFEIADMILMPDVREEGKVGTPRDAEYFLQDLKNGEEEGLYEGGVIKLKRNGSDEYLTYIENEKYEELKNQPKTADNLEKLKKHFTLDEEGKIIVIGWKEIITQTAKYKDGVLETAEPVTTTTYEYKDIPYNYKDVLEQYEVDFNFLYALLIYGSQNTQFAYDFAKYIIEETDVVFMIYDNENTTIEEKTTTYDEEITFEGQVGANYSETNIGRGTLDKVDFEEPYPKKIINYKEEVITTTTEVLSFIDIQKANLWCANFTYEYSVEGPNVIEENEQNQPYPEAIVSYGSFTKIDPSSYEFYNDIKDKIDKCEELQKGKLKEILKDVLIAEAIKQDLSNNIGELTKESEINDYNYLVELSFEFIEMVKTNNIVRTDIHSIYTNKKIDDYMKNNSGVLLEDIPSSEISVNRKALNKIEENLKNFANDFQESNYDNAEFENLVWENIINVKENRKHINKNIKTKLTKTETKYNKVNYTFTEKTNINQENGDNIVKLYKKYNIKMEYDWLEEVVNSYDAPQSSKDIFLYMVKMAIEGKGYTENKLESTIVTNDIITTNNNSTSSKSKGEMSLNASELIIDKDTATKIIDTLSNQKAKQKLNENINTIMEYQENEGISALFVIAAIDVEYDGTTEEINVDEFLQDIKQIQNNSENNKKTINEVCNEYAQDAQWANAVINKMNSLNSQIMETNMKVYLTWYKPTEGNDENYATAWLGTILKDDENGKIGIVHPNVYTNEHSWYVYEYENKRYVMLARLRDKTGNWCDLQKYEIVKFEFRGRIYEGIIFDWGGKELATTKDREYATLDLLIKEECEYHPGCEVTSAEQTNTCIKPITNYNNEYNTILRYD